MKNKLMTIKEIEKYSNAAGEFDEKIELSKEEIKDLCFYQHYILAKIQRIKNEKIATRSLKAYFDNWEEKLEKLDNLLSNYKQDIKVIEKNIGSRICWSEATEEVAIEIKELTKNN